MSTPISSLNVNPPTAAANVASNAAPAARPQPATKAATDTVELTEAQRVYQLYNQGQKVAQIATSLSLSEAAVNGYLNLPGAGG
jgi:DNA-binding NarL/FixJ family response regulator